MGNILLVKTRLSSALKDKNKRSKSLRNLSLNKPLFAFAMIMVVFGLVFTYSSSAFDSMHYFKRQLFFDLIGVFLMIFLAKYSFYIVISCEVPMALTKTVNYPYLTGFIPIHLRCRCIVVFVEWAENVTCTTINPLESLGEVSKGKVPVYYFFYYKWIICD